MGSEMCIRDSSKYSAIIKVQVKVYSPEEKDKKETCDSRLGYDDSDNFAYRGLWRRKKLH